MDLRPGTSARSVATVAAAIIVLTACVTIDSGAPGSIGSIAPTAPVQVTIGPTGAPSISSTALPTGAAEVTPGAQGTQKPPTTQAPATPSAEPAKTTVATGAPTTPPTSAPTLPPATPGKLDYSLTPTYGAVDLATGFVPDPYSVSVTSGGTVSVSYIGANCAGYATSPPDFELTYAAGSFPLLRIYFIGDGDTSLVVNDPLGNYYCVDDSFGTINPTIDFNSPASGTYDIWVASFAQLSYVSGTLYVTETDANHPSP